MGASLGSFSLVVVRRGHNNDWKSWLTGQSYCESCKKTLQWWEMIPTFSFLALRGKCSKCRTKIDPSHFLCETCVGIAYVILLFFYQDNKIDLITLVCFLITHLLFIALSSSDFLYREVNSIMVYILGLVGCAYQAIVHQNYLVIPITIGLFVIVGIVFANDNFALIGSGDIDVGIAIFALLGNIFGIIDVLLYSAACGIVMFICLYRKTEKAIPFVPCLYIGYILSAMGFSISQEIFNLCQKMF
jgi:prepilin signal peptidase PulO-like enzyme (type II secretory pathway)